MAKQSGQSKREKSARDAAAAIEPTLARLTIAAPTSVTSLEGFKITRDKVAVPPEAWGSDVPVDPGDHVVAASAPGYEVWSTTVSVAASNSKSVTIPDLQALPKAAPADGRAPTSEGSRAPASAPLTSALADQPSQAGPKFWNTQRALALVAGGVGVAGGVFAIVEFVAFSDKKDELEHVCPALGCANQADKDRASTLHDQAASARTLSIVGAVVGGVGLVTGTVLWLTVPSAPASTQTVGFVPSVGPHRWMLTIERTF